MNTIIYIFMFMMGVVLGSFYTLAIYRIPLKQDITHTRSYCPKCNHKLNFWDLIPVLSYIFLGGKCRYCKDKIRPRYFIIEVLSGILFLIFAIWLKLDVLNIEIAKIVTLIFGIMFISTVFIVVGILKEYKKIQRSVFNFGIISEVLYMVYLCILNTNIYRYVIYLILLLIMTIINNKDKVNNWLRMISFIIFILIGIIEISVVLI